MIRQIIYRLLKPRHFWRVAGFDELSEIYASIMIRSLSINLTGVFIPLYMFKLGYSLTSIVSLFVWYFVFRALIFDYLAGILTAKYGPKHTILASYLLIILSTGLFLVQPQTHWPLWILGAVWGGSTSWFTIPFGVDFSKINHKAHGGKELGYVTIMDRLGAISGPVIGGIVATLFGGQYIFLVAIILLLIGAYPLLQTKEPMQTHRHFNLSSINIRAMRRDLVSFGFYNIELTLTSWAWPVYLALFVLTGAVYAKMGALASIAVIASLTSAYAIGHLIDNSRGRLLLRFSATANAGLHIFRVFISTYPMALLVNIINEVVTIGYHLPYSKGLYDAADEKGDNRIAYMVVMEMFGSSIKALTWVLIMIMTIVFSDKVVLQAAFIVAAIASLLIMTEKFKALNIRVAR